MSSEQDKLVDAIEEFLVSLDDLCEALDTDEPCSFCEANPDWQPCYGTSQKVT